MVFTSPTDCRMVSSSRLWSGLSDASNRRRFAGLVWVDMDPRVIGADGEPQPKRKVIPRALRESMNVELLTKIKFERTGQSFTPEAQKKPPEQCSGGGFFRAYRPVDQAFIAFLTASAVIGSDRTRAPQALKIAFPIAGAT